MKNILIGILLVVVLVLGFLFLKGNKSQESNEFFENDFSSENRTQLNTNNNQTQTNTNTQTPPTNPPAQGGGNTTTIMVPLIISSESEFASADFGPFGCGAYIRFIPRQVPQTQAVLNATYEWLFSNPSSFDGGNYYNTIATQTNLDFQSVEIVNGTAKVYLTGSVMGAHCGDATFGAQIEQAAFQYPTVTNIEVYVNGELFDWCDISDADPEEGGCDTTPQSWNYQRFNEY